MFSGTLRENLDPFAEYGDEALWAALADTNLKHFVESSLTGKLDAEVTESGAADRSADNVFFGRDCLRFVSARFSHRFSVSV